MRASRPESWWKFQRVSRDKYAHVRVWPDRSGISLTNGVGTIDSDYRGEVVVLVINHGDAPYTFQPGDRIAQLIIMPVPKVVIKEVEELAQSSVRGAGGFGSTGVEALVVDDGGKPELQEMSYE